MKSLAMLMLVMIAGTFASRDLMTKQSSERTMDYVYEFKTLESKRAENNRSWLQFLDVDSMYCGIYCLKVGEKDAQKPHQHDEIYIVEKGKAKIAIRGKDYELSPGSIVFVPAQAEHHFHSITEDLKTIVFFSKLEPAKFNENHQ